MSGEHPANDYRVACVLLAAGGSTRMGRPKQLLPVGGAPLVLRATETLLACRLDPVVVVLGHASDTIRPVLAKTGAMILDNSAWASGIGSSIRTGIEFLTTRAGSLDGAMTALTDQPGLSESAVAQLLAAFRGPHSLVAARYAGALGAPAIFGRDYFPELLALPAEAGAQRVLKAHADAVNPVDLPALATDLDTPEDYRRYTADRLSP